MDNRPMAVLFVTSSTAVGYFNTGPDSTRPVDNSPTESRSVMNAAARLITGTQQYERGLSRLMHDDLHWLTEDAVQARRDGPSMEQCMLYRIP